MLFERIVVGLILLPFFGLMIYLGGWIFALTMMFILGFSGWEYWRMVRQGGYAPSLYWLVGGILAIVLLTQLWGTPGMDFSFSLIILAVMGISVFGYERGQEHPVTEFAIMTLGLVYLGWMGSHLLPLRALPDGVWWIGVSLPASWFADIGAFFVGSQVGKHRLAPRVSPRKSWEGYLGGLPFAIAWSTGFAWYAQSYVPAISPLKGALLGILIGLTAPLGDLFESLLKRQFGIKDTSHIFPGHGGMMDRIDTTLWTGVVSYYLIVLFMR